MDIQRIINPQELLANSQDQTPYAFENFIKLGTMGERRRSKRKLKLLKVIDRDIRNIIDEDETVFFVTEGVLVKAAEQFFIGWVAYYYNQTAFVFTTKRVLLIHMKDRKHRGVFLRCIEYADIRAIKGSAFSTFKIQLRNGKTLAFSRMPGADRKELAAFLNQILDNNAPWDYQAIGMRNLCPNCLTDYGEALVEECRHCGLEFKRPGKAALLSLIMPGLGDIYLGSKVLGFIELIFMGILWLSFIAAAFGEASTGDSLLFAFFMLFFLWLFIHPIDAAKAYFMGIKGLFPKQVVTTCGTAVPRDINDPVIPSKAGKSKAKLLLILPAGAFAALLIFFLIIGLLVENKLLPDTTIVPGSELPESTRQQFVENGIIEPESKIVFVYGDGFLSFLESGTMLTERELIIYFHDDDNQLLIYQLPLDEIVEVTRVQEGNGFQDAFYKAVADDPEKWIQFNLPVEADGDTRFISELQRRIGNSGISSP